MNYIVLNLLLLAGDNVADEADPSKFNFLEKLIPNLYVFLIQLAAFIIMVLVVIKFAYKPIKKFITNRHNYIESNLNEAKTKNEEANAYLKEAKDSLSNSKKEAIQIIADAKIDANKQRSAILESTQQEIANKRAEAVENLRKEQEKAIKSVHDEVVNLAIEASKSILEREVNISDDDKMINSLVDDLMDNR